MNQPKRIAINPLAGLLALAIPGLGHVYLGERGRGAFVATGVLGMILGGLLIGGIDVVDSKEDKWWFYGQALAGPVAFGIDWYNQSATKVVPVAVEQTASGYTTPLDANDLDARPRVSVQPGHRREVVDLTTADNQVRRVPVAIPDDQANPPKSVGLGKVNEIGTLYVLCAGMLNLIAVIDALVPGPRRNVPRTNTPKAAAETKPTPPSGASA